MPHRHSSSGLFANPVLSGAIAVLITVLAVYLSYGAGRGLPFVPTYQISANYPDAAKLRPGDEVRIGGARVGIVKGVDAEPGQGLAPPFARISMALTKRQHLPIDTTISIRPRSILGAKYVALTPGISKTLVPQGGLLPLSQARPVVEIDDTFKAFDPQTRRGLRGLTAGFGDALAGRGAGLNATIGTAAHLFAPLERVARNLVSRQTNLSGFISGAAAFTGALAPAAGGLGPLLEASSITFAALTTSNPQLGQTLDKLPGTESAATVAFARALPTLDDAAAIASGLRDATPLLAQADNGLANVLEAAVPPLSRTKLVTDQIPGLVGVLNSLDYPGAPFLDSVRLLNLTIDSVLPALRLIAPAQTACNIFGSFARNYASAFSQGDAVGALTVATLLQGSPQNYQHAQRDANLHTNFFPLETASRCESGNESYAAGQALGSPASLVSNGVDATAPPAGATALARGAGLLAHTPGANAP